MSPNPEDFVIKRKRKKYRFARFSEAPNCFEVEDWEAFTLPDVPIILEIGGGTGLFSVKQAKLAPEKFFVVIDIKADRLQKGAYEALDVGLRNVIFLRAHAWELSTIFPAHIAHTIWVTFPDPYPKKRAAKHRLTHPVFLRQYRNSLTTKGTLFFKTDSHVLFDWSLEQLVAESWRIKQLDFDLHTSDLPDSYKVMTTYEERFFDQGLPIGFVAAIPVDTN